MEAVLSKKKIVHKAGEVSRSERPPEIASSSLAGIICVESVNHHMKEANDLDINDVVMTFREGLK